MPGPGTVRHFHVAFVAAGIMLALVVVALPAPAQALSGEERLEIHKAFVITYDNVSGSDVIWWDWEVTGKVVKMTFWIILTDPELSVKVETGASLTILKEFCSKSTGQIKLRDGYHTATVKWACHALQYVTFRYHAMLNPPDLAMYYSLAAFLWMVPVLVIGVCLIRKRRRKASPVSRPAAG